MSNEVDRHFLEKYPQYKSWLERITGMGYDERIAKDLATRIVVHLNSYEEVLPELTSEYEALTGGLKDRATRDRLSREIRALGQIEGEDGRGLSRGK